MPTTISIDDLPKYTDWPQKLLGAAPAMTRYKTEQEVVREFQNEKWAQLLQQAHSLQDLTLDAVERVHAASEALHPRYDSGAFYLASEQYMLARHLELYADVLAPHVGGASCLVELGAGYGSKLLGLAQRPEFSSLPLYAAEYTDNGRRLISMLAGAMKKEVAVGACDFRKLTISGIEIPENAVIFTSYAVHYVPELPSGLIELFADLRPKIVVNFEPCYEDYPSSTLHGLMCRRYVELNDYSRNLSSLVAAARLRGLICVKTHKNVLGSNPFLPISVIEWMPA